MALRVYTSDVDLMVNVLRWMCTPLCSPTLLPTGHVSATVALATQMYGSHVAVVEAAIAVMTAFPSLFAVSTDFGRVLGPVTRTLPWCSDHTLDCIVEFLAGHPFSAVHDEVFAACIAAQRWNSRRVTKIVSTCSGTHETHSKTSARIRDSISTFGSDDMDLFATVVDWGLGDALRLTDVLGPVCDWFFKYKSMRKNTTAGLLDICLKQEYSDIRSRHGVSILNFCFLPTVFTQRPHVLLGWFSRHEAKIQEDGFVFSDNTIRMIVQTVTAGVELSTGLDAWLLCIIRNCGVSPAFEDAVVDILFPRWLIDREISSHLIRVVLRMVFTANVRKFTPILTRAILRKPHSEGVQRSKDLMSMMLVVLHSGDPLFFNGFSNAFTETAATISVWHPGTDGIWDLFNLVFGGQALEKHQEFQSQTLPARRRQYERCWWLYVVSSRNQGWKLKDREDPISDVLADERIARPHAWMATKPLWITSEYAGYILKFL